MSIKTQPGSLDSKNDAPIGARLGDGTDEFVLIRRDLLAVGLDRGKTRDLMSPAAQTASDNKSVPEPTLGKSSLSTLDQKSQTSVGRAMSAIKMPTVKTRIAYKVTATGGSGAALATVIPVEPATSGEFTSFASLFQECKTTAGEIHWHISTSVPASSNSPLGCVLSYEDMSSAALGSVASGLEAKVHDLRLLDYSSTATVSSTSSGLWSLRFSVPKSSARSSATATKFVGEWSDISDAADTYGYLKLYAEAPGGSVTVTLTAWVVLDVMFRSRA
jgi:hypothetical protein